MRNTTWTLLTALLVVTATNATAQLPISARLGIVGGQQEAKITASAPGVELGSPSSTLYSLGGEVVVGLPIGLHVGAHYQRHFGDIDGGFDENISALDFSLGGNEVGAFVEKQWSLLPMSPMRPHLGAGAGYSRLMLGQEVSADGIDAGELDADVDLYRLYALGGLDLPGGLGAKLRLGWLFGSIDGSDLVAGQTFTLPGGEEVSFDIEYDGFFASLTVTLFGF